MYVVNEAFNDRDGHHYKVDDIYPHDGVKVTKARITTLSTNKNKYERPFIFKAKEENEEVGE